MVAVNITKLPNEKKQFLWLWLKENRPELASLLQQGDVREAQKVFDAEVIIELEPSEIEDVKKKFALVRPESV